ncbi:uncharacterized protein ACA1_090320 [Acanthamoeba castellanii str. Neff]|uniref:SET domain-containing protein n=1 Tax=Acanthamoeba castellanii (strain ATCC 30010 / Neff) TaxID=1257118 RepID=L8GU75_ACACF|nr:uncharacterized protein ACA1_090320 [Acanthamoeba castellanii str. Neff]ELR16734.1 hypothetical protein ACA1_090320 [Acanthamoeba castellanii str. Neff]
MEEATKLKQVRKGATTPVPLPVSYWLYFKRAILERPEVREQFASAPLGPDQFRALLKKEANPAKWGPSFCRTGRGRSDSTVRRMTTDMLAVVWRYYEALLHPDSPIYVAESKRAGGLGLFARRTSTVAVESAFAPAHLFGICFGVTEEQFSELESVGYPSLYWHEPSILYGPLSLINHKCGSLLCFSFSRKIDPRQRQAAGKAVTLEEFAGLSAVYTLAIQEGCRIKEHQEITIDYFNTGGDDDDKKVTFFGAPCRCRTCSK